MSPNTNEAAWIIAHRAHPYSIGPGPLGEPGADQVLVKNHALAINPLEIMLQNSNLYKENVQYPSIYGEDVAGKVVSVGKNVTRFKIGDRVAGLALGFYSQKKEEMAFQQHTILSTALAAKVPDTVSYEQAAVFPLGLSTAAAGLFEEDALALQLPTVPARKDTGETVLVWGGAGCVGSNAVQLAVAAGYRVISTCSPKNFDKIKKLGASAIFDYNSPTVVADLLEAAKGTTIAGVFDAVAGPAWPFVVEFASKASGNKKIATVLPGFSGQLPEGISMKPLFAFSIASNHVAKAIWEDFLPKAFEEKSFVTAPEPFIFGKGLESLQGAVDHLRTKGTSAQKIVVSLE